MTDMTGTVRLAREHGGGTDDAHFDQPCQVVFGVGLDVDHVANDAGVVAFFGATDLGVVGTDHCGGCAHVLNTTPIPDVRQVPIASDAHHHHRAATRR